MPQSAAFLRNLRKKFGLGEFKRKKPKRIKARVSRVAARAKAAYKRRKARVMSRKRELNYAFQ